jgi:hypothetical protein
VTSLVEAGALTRVLEDWCAPFPGFFLYYPGRRQLSPALAALIDAIRVPVKRGNLVNGTAVNNKRAIEQMPRMRQAGLGKYHGQSGCA